MISQKFSNSLNSLLFLTLLHHANTQPQNLVLNTTDFSASPLLPNDRGHFGTSIDISPDGQLAFVSANTALNFSGSVFYFEQSFGEWSGGTEVQPQDSDSLGQPLFGGVVKLWENRLAVSAPNFNESTGAVYMFESQNGVWVQIQRIDGNSVGNGFGEALVLEGDWLLVSSSNLIPNEPGQIFVYKYSESSQIWEFYQFLYPNNPAISYGFGSSLDISGTNAIAVQHRAFRNSGTGVSIYGLRSPNGTWVNDTFLPLPEPYCPSAVLYRDMILVSCNSAWGGTSDGDVHVFRRSLRNGMWEETTDAIVPTDPRGYGNVVAASGNRLAVGAAYTSQVYRGTVETYVFLELIGTDGPDGSSAGVWVPELVIFPFTSEFESFLFGISVAVFPTGILIGADIFQGGRGTVYYVELPLVQALTSLTNVTTDFPQLLVMNRTSLIQSNITVISNVIISGTLILEDTNMNIQGNLINNGQMVISLSSPNAEPITVENCLQGSGLFHIILPPKQNEYEIIKQGCQYSNNTNFTIVVSYLNHQDVCQHFSYSVKYLLSSLTVVLLLNDDSCTQSWKVPVVVGMSLMGGFLVVGVGVFVWWVRRREKKYNQAMRKFFKS